MPKHAMPQPRTLGRLKVVASVLVVVVFVAMFVGGATGMIGAPGDDGGDDESLVGVGGPASPGSSDAPADPTGTESSADAAGTDAPIEPTTSEPVTPVVTDVPEQPVAGAKRLKRTLAWLRRGLADETTFRVATFNVLGNSHTAPGGNRKGFASGTARMDMAWSLISGADVSVVGFQELEDPQYYRMLSLSGWDAYPGPTLDRGSIRNSLAWDPDVWELVEAQSAGIPYFGGQIIRRPVVKLKNRESGREIWFFNTHNPASTPNHGNNARWRAAAISIEIDLANDLGADGTPVVFTGDYNDRAEAFCPLVGGTELEAANGGSYDGGCAPPDRMDVDWVFGSGIEWSGFSSVSSGVVGRVSDHPFVSATAFVPEEPLEGQSPSGSPSGSPSASESSSAD